MVGVYGKIGILPTRQMPRWACCLEFMTTSTSVVPPSAAAWPVPPLLIFSVGVHVLALGGALVWPALWGWCLGAVAVNHVLITGVGLWPRSRGLGPNVTHLPADAVARRAVALTIDDGPDAEVTPAVLDLLRTHGVQATFFVIAQNALDQPALIEAMLAQGHDVQNHSFAHRHTFSLKGTRALAAEVGAAQSALTRLTGRVPRCFRAPAGLRNPCLDPVLFRHGLHLVSWSRRGFDTRETDPAKVLARLGVGPDADRDPLKAGDIVLLHDGNAARTVQGRPVVLEVLPTLLAQAKAAGLHWERLDQALPVRWALEAAS